MLIIYKHANRLIDWTVVPNARIDIMVALYRQDTRMKGVRR